MGSRAVPPQELATRAPESAEVVEEVDSAAVVKKKMAEQKKMLLENVPDIEWWDAPFISSYDDVAGDQWRVEGSKITQYVEHPVAIEPPALGANQVSPALFPRQTAHSAPHWVSLCELRLREYSACVLPVSV